MPNQTELRQQITDRIIESLQAGQLPPWRKPWKDFHGPHRNVVSQRSYTGVNPLLLEISSQRFDFSSSLWGTFRQWKELGGSVQRRPQDVKPGRWGTTIVFARPITKKPKDHEDKESKFWILKSYTVFNLDQVDGSFDHLRPQKSEKPNLFERFEAAEQLIAVTRATIETGSRAAYVPSRDIITLPPQAAFESPADYYETAFHELVHWTEPAHRLNWDRKGEGYAMGELIAEIGACYVAAELGIPNSEQLDKSSSYIQSWLRALKDDNRAIFRASSQASRASDYLFSFVRAVEPAEITA